MIITKIGNILDSVEEYIIHQCNCNSLKPYGLSKLIFDTFPYSNCYFKRKYNNSVPETIEVCGNEINERYIINMFAQYGIGKPYSYNNSNKQWPDSYEKRLEWFNMCLEKVAILRLKSVAIPYKIGCGLAGGDWYNNYYPAILNWSNKYPEIKVVIYKL